MDKYYPQRTILWHLKVFLVPRDMLKLIFQPLRKVTKKLFGLLIHHWLITTKVIRLLWINTISKELFCDTWRCFWYFKTCQNIFLTHYEKLRKIIWPSDSPLTDYYKSRKTTMDKYYPQRTILWHLKVFLVPWDMLKLIFQPVTESYEKLFGLLIHHWPIIDKSRKTTMDKYYPQRTILWHLKVFLVPWDMLKLIFEPLRKVTKSYLAFRFTIGRL